MFLVKHNLLIVQDVRESKEKVHHLKMIGSSLDRWNIEHLFLNVQYLY